MPDEQVTPESIAAPSIESTTTPESATEGQHELQEGETKPKGGFQKKIDKLLERAAKGKLKSRMIIM